MRSNSISDLLKETKSNKVVSLNKNCYKSSIQEAHKKLHTKYCENKMKLVPVETM